MEEHQPTLWINMRTNTVEQSIWMSTKSSAYIMSGLLVPFVVTLILTSIASCQSKQVMGYKLVRAVFKWVSKVIRNCFGFVLLRSMIGVKISRRISLFGNTRFPALGTGYVYLLRVLIGSLCCLRLLWLAIVMLRFYDTQLKTAL